MCRFIESIRLSDGKIENLAYHQARVAHSMKNHFNENSFIDLTSFLSSHQLPAIGLYKIRLVYDRTVQSILVSPYFAKPIASLKIVHDDAVEYGYKHEDRNTLNALFKQRQSCDDVMLVKNGFITDSSYSNLVFKRKDRWLTPSTYLLNGTHRQYLLDQKIIEEEQIRPSDLCRYEKVKMINALLKLDGPEINVSQIV